MNCSRDRPFAKRWLKCMLALLISVALIVVLVRQHIQQIVLLSSWLMSDSRPETEDEVLAAALEKSVHPE